jgi:hypothetical protein
MPATSERQRRLMQAAAHGAPFKKAREIRASMTAAQLRDFTRGPSVGETLAEAIAAAPTAKPPTKGRR